MLHPKLNPYQVLVTDVCTRNVFTLKHDEPLDVLVEQGALQYVYIYIYILSLVRVYIYIFEFEKQDRYLLNAETYRQVYVSFGTF